MEKIKIIKYNEKEEIIFNGTGQWSEERIVCSDGTQIDYNEEELVIRYYNPNRCHLVFIKNENSFHMVSTELGVFRFKVNTKDILIQDSSITVIYELEQEKNRLVIERV